MKVAVDDRVLHNQYRNRGKGAYLKNLLRELKKVAPQVELEFPPFRQEEYDLFFQPNSDGGLSRLSCPQVVMFHDLTPLVLDRYSERGWWANALKGMFYRRNLQKVRQADFFLTNSDYTQRDLIKYLGLAPELIGVAHLGIDPVFFRAMRDPARGKRQREIKNRVGGEFFLHVGGVEYNKNLPVLIDAYAQLPSWVGDRFRLVIIGGQLLQKNKPETRLIYDRIAQHGLGGRVILRGLIPSEELPYWYQAAHLLVYPSLREGFGFPPLEAMASGTVAAVANSTSLPEVCGDAARYFDPRSVDAIRQAMIACGTRDVLRRELIERGLVRAQQFSWRKTAEKTWRYFQRLA